jgi:murein DD-endopeptidase MepM/ murein hydrolase activator NlpD
MDDYRTHNGIDIAASEGTPVKVCADGTVSDVYTDDLLGQVVVVDHGGGLKSIYANLSDQVTVKKGQDIEAGTVVGCVGHTAMCEVSIAPHLHFAITKDGNYVDPLITMGQKK